MTRADAMVFVAAGAVGSLTNLIVFATVYAIGCVVVLVEALNREFNS